MPEIVPLEVWGGTANGWPQMALPAVGIWVHHSVTEPSGDAQADFRVLDRIGRSQGHGGISYSYAIHPDGTIGEGQGSRRGAHTGGQGCSGSPWGWNPCTYGICFVGNYQDLIPSAASIEAFRWLRDVLAYVGGLAEGYTIGGHRDAPGNATACPGNNLEDVLPELRAPYNPAPTPEEENPMLYVTRESTPQVGVWAADGVWKRHIGPDEWSFISYVSPDKAKVVPISDAWFDSLPDASLALNDPPPAEALSAEQRAAIEASITAGNRLEDLF